MASNFLIDYSKARRDLALLLNLFEGKGTVLCWFFIHIGGCFCEAARTLFGS